MQTSEIEQTLIALERSLLTPEVRANRKAVAALLAPDFREFGASGRIWTREEILAELASETSVQLEASDFKVDLLSPSLALVTYRSTRTQAGHPPRHALRSSLWRLEAGHWLILFHQGTVIRPASVAARCPRCRILSQLTHGQGAHPEGLARA